MVDGTPPPVFATSAPAIVDAYLTARHAARAARLRAIAAAEEIGLNKGPVVRRGVWGTPNAIVGLFTDDPANPPEGWRYIKSRERLEPVHGAAGEAARAWLKTYQLPTDPRMVLHNLGLPRHGRKPHPNGFSEMLTEPRIVAHNGMLWANYGDSVPDDRFSSVPGPDGGLWQRRKVSEFYAAAEAADEIAAKENAERREVAADG